MIYQWYLFILIAVVAVIAFATKQIYTVDSFGQREYRSSWIPLLAIVVPMIYWAANRPDMGFGDTSAYRNWFKDFPIGFSNIFSYITGDYKDRGFYVFSIIIKTIIGQRVILYFGIIAALCLFCVVDRKSVV